MPTQTTVIDQGRDIEIPKLEVVFQDPFDLKSLYKRIFWWLVDEGYVNNLIAGGNEGTPEPDLEVFYSEITRAGNVKEYEFWWRCEKPTANPYFRYKIMVDYLGLGMKDTEVVKGEKKYKMQIGEITVRLRAFVIVEAQTRKGQKFDVKWENHWFLKHIKEWFNQKLYATKKEEHEDFLYEDLTKLQQAIKNHLELQQYEQTPEEFFHPKGY